jgi:hypothetical protein
VEDLQIRAVVAVWVQAGVVHMDSLLVEQVVLLLA